MTSKVNQIAFLAQELSVVAKELAQNDLKKVEKKKIDAIIPNLRSIVAELTKVNYYSPLTVLCDDYTYLSDHGHGD